MGPLLFRAEDSTVSTWDISSQVASMGPLLFRAEDVGVVTGPPKPSQSFNGAALVQSGRLQYRPNDPRVQCIERFNGAALVQSGRRARIGHAAGQSRQASMGPLLFRAEDTPQQ